MMVKLGNFAAVALCGAALAMAAGCGGKAQAGHEYFRCGVSKIGQVQGGKVALMDFGGSWEVDSFAGLPVPAGWKQVIGFNNGGIGVWVGGKARLFAPIQARWQEVKEAEFAVPAGALRLTDFDEDKIAAVFPGKLRIYGFQPGSGWKEDAARAFDIPANARDVFSFGSTILAVVGPSSVSFREFSESSGWGASEVKDLALPAGHGQVLAFHANGVAAVMGAEMAFFRYASGAWEEVPEAKLKLPLK